MKITSVEKLSREEKEIIFQLWNNEYPVQLQYTDMSQFEDYLQRLNNQRHYFLIDDAGNRVGWAFVFIRENVQWFAIIVDGSMHSKGFGTLLIDFLKQKHSVLYGWVTDHDHYKKINGAPYKSPLAFYIKNGFSVLEGQRLETEKLSAVKIIWQAGIQG